MGASSIGLKLLVRSFAPICWSHKTTHEEVTNTGPPQIQINRIGFLVLKLCLVEVYSVRRERERERAHLFFAAPEHYHVLRLCQTSAVDRPFSTGQDLYPSYPFG